MVEHITYFNTSNVEVPHFWISTPDKTYFNFNTSNVEVPRCCKVIAQCNNRISIHPMWRFREGSGQAMHSIPIFQYIQCGGSAYPWVVYLTKAAKFQYIQCGGSAAVTLMKKEMVKHFNTSNVEVPHIPKFHIVGDEVYFNTSNVEVPLPRQ